MSQQDSDWEEISSQARSDEWDFVSETAEKCNEPNSNDLIRDVFRGTIWRSVKRIEKTGTRRGREMRTAMTI